MLAREMSRCCAVKLSKLRETENQLVVDVVRSASGQSVQGFSNCCDHFLATSQLFGWCCISSNQISSHSGRLISPVPPVLQYYKDRTRILSPSVAFNSKSSTSNANTGQCLNIFILLL